MNTSRDRQAIISRDDATAGGANRRHCSVLVLDCSGSMQEDRKIEELNLGLLTLQEEVGSDPELRNFCELAVVTFGGEQPELARDFCLGRNFVAPTLHASGRTPLGAAVRLATEVLETRMKELIRESMNLYTPILVLMSDGIPTDDWETVADEVRRREALDRKQLNYRTRRLHSFPILIQGGQAEGSVLARFSGEREPLVLRDIKLFKELFRWLKFTLVEVAASGGRDYVVPNPRSWGRPISA